MEKLMFPLKRDAQLLLKNTYLSSAMTNAQNAVGLRLMLLLGKFHWKSTILTEIPQITPQKT